MTDVAVNLLLPLHQQANAEFQAYGDIEIVSTFGEPQAEYAAIRKTAALIDLPQRGVLQLTGVDRLFFLNNLLTNQTFNKETKTPMAAGQGVYAFLLNARTGRIIADLNVLELGDRTLLEADSRLLPTLQAELEKYIFAEKVQITRSTLHEIVLHGAGAGALLGQAAQSLLGSHSSQQIELFGIPIILWRDDPAAVPGYHLLIPAESAQTVWTNLLSQHGQSTEIGKRALRPAGWAAFNATRIEGGRPVFGIDFDDTFLPAETGQLLRAVSFTKGCYPGQEIVARMHARQQVAKQLVGIRFSDDSLPIAGAPVYDAQQNQIGAITSSTISPILSNTALALALVRKPFYAIGSAVHVPAEGAIRSAVVCEIPFLPKPGNTK